MPQKPATITFLLCLFMALQFSCRKCEPDVICFQKGLPIEHIGFNNISPTESDSSFIVYYLKNTNFSAIVDTLYLEVSIQGNGTGVGDYVIYQVCCNGLKLEHDWDIFIKKLNLHKKVTDFEIEDVYCSDCLRNKKKETPVPTLKSYKVDGIKREGTGILIER